MTRAFDFSRRSLLGGVAGLGAGALLGTRSARAAPVRGGRLVYGRYADSQFLDPVLNDANVEDLILWLGRNSRRKSGRNDSNGESEKRAHKRSIHPPKAVRKATPRIRTAL